MLHADPQAISNRLVSGQLGPIPACPFGRVPEGNESCMKWNEGVIAFLADLRPDAVITNSSRMRDQQEHVPDGYVEQWQRLAVMGIKVIGIRDNPEFQFRVAACVARNRDNPGVCAVPKEVFYPGPDPASRHVAELGNLVLVDATDWFCNDDSCPAASAGYLMYGDQHHLSVSCGRYLTSALERRLSDVAPEIFQGDRRNLGYQAPKDF